MRVCLFGIDGLTFRVLDPLMEQGLLPHFQQVRERGAQGILQSTVLPMTPPAWMSIATGLSPAKHGVYDFWDYTQDTKGALTQIITHRKDGKALWNILSEWNKQVIVANVPVTYPPEPVNGIIVSGLMTPLRDANFTYPASFKEELLQAIPDYQIDLSPAVINGQIGDPFAETVNMTRKRLALLRLLLDKPWDFFFIVFTGADRLQHLCWDDIMALHPRAVEYYQMVDQALGFVLASLQAEDLLLIVSDHGFQGARRLFYIQEYLYRQGLLQMNRVPDRRGAALVERARDVAWTLGLRGVPTRIRRRLRELGVLPVLHEYHIIPSLDLNQETTRAWVPVRSGAIAGYADIFLDEDMTREEIAALEAALQAIRDPETGQPLVTELYREDRFGSGPFAPRRRHLVIHSGENTTLLPDLGVRDLWRTVEKSAGIHHPDGILYLYGAGVRRGMTIDPAHVYDIVPTILSRMGLPLPANLDGAVIAEAFEGAMKAARQSGEGDSIRSRLKQLKS